MSLIPVQQRNISVKAHILVMSLLLVIAFTIMEPVFAGGMNFYTRLVFFSLHIFPAVFIAWKVSGFLFNRSISTRFSPWLLLAMAGAIAGLFLAPLSVFLEIIFGVVDYSVMPRKRLEYSLDAFLNELDREWFAVVPKTTIFWPLMNATLSWKFTNNESFPSIHLGKPKNQLDSEQSYQGDSDLSEGYKTELKEVAPGFIQLLPVRLGVDVIYLKSEEHYLKVVTPLGEKLILYGLKNAIHDLEKMQINGLLVHRSYWVSMKHIEKIEVESGIPNVYLSNGFKVPISRRKRREVISMLREFL